jgi:hypothetical protein
MGQVNVVNLSGAGGSKYITAAGPHTGDFYAIQFVADSVITAMAGNMEGSADLVSDAVTFSKGDVIYGSFSSLTFSAASQAILYKR